MLYHANNYVEFEDLHKNHLFKFPKSEHLKSQWNVQKVMNQISGNIRFTNIDYGNYNHVYNINLMDVGGEKKWEIVFSIIDKFGTPNITSYLILYLCYNKYSELEISKVLMHELVSEIIQNTRQPSISKS